MVAPGKNSIKERPVMNDHRFDSKMVAAPNRRSDETNTFVASVMRKIKIAYGNQSTKKQTSVWKTFLNLKHGHNLAFGILAVLVVSTVAFSGYAYAIGSDPISLIKRWVEGDKVKIEYQGREFEHGATRNYSDAAITALAEANTAQGLAFHAANKLAIPKDGVEYVSVPASLDPASDYRHPYFATITSVNDQTVTLNKQYAWGDKMSPSQSVDETVQIPTVNFRYYVKGEPVAATADSIGKLAMVFTDTSMRHVISTNEVTKEVNYFGFELTHDLDSFKEIGVGDPIDNSKDSALFEPSWGGLSNLCLNNGADACDIYKFSKPENHGLFVQVGSRQIMNAYNPDAISYGEGVGPGESQPQDLISRNLMGEIVSISDTHFVLKTSSGANWKLAFDKDKQKAFSKRYSELKVGDKLVGQVLESVHNLNNREIDNRRIGSMERY
jgi:hypothetical protein